MSGDFHVLPTPKLKRAAKDCPLLECDSQAWIACCSRRFLPLAKRIAGDDRLAEDVLQTSWIKILQSINHACFDGPKACPWVHTIVTNTAKDFHGKRVRRREDPLQDERAPAQDPEALAQERELLVLLREMIDLLPGNLPPGHQAASVPGILQQGDLPAPSRLSRQCGRPHESSHRSAQAPY